MSLPEKYETYMKELLGGEYGLYKDSLEMDRVCGLRANTLKIKADKLENMLDMELKPVPWCKDGFYYKNLRPAKNPLYHAGLYYIQEPSAMAPVALTPINRGDRVLDICAAPGGKSTYIGAKLEGTGLLVSNDVSAARTSALLKNMEISGVKNGIVLCETPKRLSEKFVNFFHKIVIDAPCSGEGMFRKDLSAVKSWEVYKKEKCAAIQREILYYAKQMLRSGGIITYSTCTLNTLENEEMVKGFIEENPEFEIMKLDYVGLGISPGIDIGGGTANCGRIWPHRQNGEGHFIALLRHKGDSMKASPLSTVNEKINGFEYFQNFCREYMNTEINEGFIAHRGSLIVSPIGIAEIKGLRIIRCGWYLGELKTKRFEPSQALAMGLKANEFKNIINFDIGDVQLYKYLKGESFDSEASTGYNLVCTDNYPLGFGKVLKGRLKNKYMKSWTMD